MCRHLQVGQIFLSATMADRGIVKKHFMIKTYFCHACYVLLDANFKISAEVFQLLKRWNSRVPNPKTAAFSKYFETEDDWFD